MKVFTHPVVLALGTSTFYLLVLIAPLISPSHTAIYHFSGEPIVVFAPVLLYVFVFWLLLTGLFQWARNPGWPYLILWSILILSFPWRLLKNLFSLADRPLPHLLSIAAFLVPLFALIAIVIFRRPHVLPWFERTRHFVATILGFASLTGLVFLGQLLWFGWQARSLNHPRPLHSRHLATPAQTPKTRIIWILLDELSYQQVYEQRYPGLALPAFDQLAAQSTIFTQVVPAGIYTERVLPSLISGMPVDRTYSSSSGQLSLHNSSTNEWQSFDQHQTVFQDALNDGYSTAIAGWYNPYCRIMPQVLDQCFWTFNSANLGGMAPSQSITENLLEPLRSERTSILTLINRLHQLHASDIQSFRLHKQDYDEIFAAADHLLGDRSANFILLHLPIPQSITAGPLPSLPATPPISTAWLSPTGISRTFAPSSSSAASGILPQSSSWEITPGEQSLCGAPGRPGLPKIRLPAMASSLTIARPTSSRCRTNSSPSASATVSTLFAPALFSTPSSTISSDRQMTSLPGPVNNQKHSRFQAKLVSESCTRSHGQYR